MLDDGSGYLAFKEKANKTKSKKRVKKAKTKKIKTKGKSEAKKVAEKTLKDSLKQEYSINLTVDGDVMYCAGCIIELDDSYLNVTLRMEPVYLANLRFYYPCLEI